MRMNYYSYKYLLRGKNEGRGREGERGERERVISHEVEIQS